MACMLVLLVVAGGYVLGMSAWQAQSEPLADLSDLLIPRALDAFVAFWLLFIGASIGSFLNVVAWRMPQGMSINGRSHCPRCNQALAWRDNLPVVGWIILGGRCRSCRLPISPRYPIVEAVVGLSVLLVGIRGLHSDAAHLPFWTSGHAGASSLALPTLSPQSLTVIVYHIVAVAVLWALALVRSLGARIPRRLTVVSLTLLVLPMVALPVLAVVPWSVTAPPEWRPESHLNAIMRVLTSLAMGGLLGQMLASHLCPTADLKLEPLGEGSSRLLDLSVLLTAAALIVGWQAVLAVTVLATLIGAVVPRFFVDAADPLGRFAIGVPIAVSVQIGFWDRLHGLPWWPSVNTYPSVTLLWAAAILVLPRLLIKAPRHRATESAADPVARG